ncbi:hypothetical protein L9F63_004301 [Diploptera punctata]|uniref:Platelet-derived growth factor receptor-like protein n=1 Tax=Diploptera punctata TaxID=6984 RepID=A0AAD7ZGA8_DIPPU|nr:hypothetical protein L9F63_004301 [Diploptera punctata]
MYRITCILVSLFTWSLVTGVNYERRTINTGDDIQLQCESEFPVHWCFPPNYESPDESKSITYTSPAIMKHTRNSKYITTLVVKSANYMYTGFYHCLKNDTDLPCNRDIQDSERSMYVYVQDPENLMVIKSYKVVQVMKKHDAVLPCLPTSPNVVVTLRKNDQEVRDGKLPNSDTTVTYDPTKGYIIKYFTLRDSGDYICTAEYRDKQEELICDVRITSTNPVTYLVSPTIKRMSKVVKEVFIHVDDELRLVCETSQSTHFQIQWNFPEKSKPDVLVNRCLSQSVICSSNSTLAISRVSSSDSGEYTCLVSARNLKTVRTTVKVQVQLKDIEINGNEDDKGNVGSKLEVVNMFMLLIIYFILN